MNTKDRMIDRVALFNIVVGESYRDGVLALSTLGLRRRMRGRCGDHWYHETLEKWGRENTPRLLRTGGHTLLVTYAKGRWSWERVAKRTRLT